jgi:hypothetical protein
MRESFKAVLLLVVLVSATMALVVWLDDDPVGASVWMTWGSTGTAVVSLALLLKIHFRKDDAPDYLSQYAANFFNRSGFAFAIDVIAIDGVAYGRVIYQNQFSGRCQARVALRPGQNFFLKRAAIETICFDIVCGPGEFGMAFMPLAIGAERQGKKQTFEVGASARYPDGSRRQLRFRDGIMLRYDSDFANPFHTALQVGYLVAGGIMLKSPAKATIVLPTGVAAQLPSDVTSRTETLWVMDAAGVATEFTHLSKVTS